MDDINDILVKIEEQLDKLLNDSSKDDMVFVKHGLLPMDFFMKPAANQVEANILKKFKKLVEIFGGKLSFSMSSRSPNVIVFSLFKHINFTSDYDVFLAQYLIDCFKAGTLLDLKQYRATKSKYPSSLEPNEIALGLKSWSDFQKEKENSGEEASDFSDNEGSSLVNSGKPPNFVASTSSAKNYSREEELKILNYIISQRYYFRVKGNMIWKRMEEKKICGRRSWQSMKQRYLKHIIPGIDHFNLSPEMKRRILATFNKGANVRTRFAKTAEPSKSESENDFCDSETEKNVTTKNCSSSLSDTEVEDFSNKNTSDRTPKKSLILSNEDQSSDNSDSSFSPLVSNMKVGHNSESYIEKNNLPHPEGNCSDKDNPVQQDVNVISTQSQHICNKEKQPTENGTDSVISSVNEIRKPIHHSEPNRSPKSPTPKVNNSESDASVVSESETENFAQRHNICSQETSYHDHECRLLLSPLNCYSTFPEPAQIENRTSGHDSDETTIFNRIELIEQRLGRTCDICETEEKSEEEPLPKSVAFIQKSPVGNQNTGIHSKKKSSCESENPQVEAKCRNTQTSSEDDSEKEIPYQLGHKRKQIIAPKTLPRFNCSSSDCESGATSKVIKNHERKHSKNNQAHYSSKAATSHSGSRDLTSPDSKMENKTHDRKQRLSAPSSSPIDFSDDSTEGVYIVGKMKMYSKADDITILKHLYKYNLFNKVGGRAVWEDMEARNVVPGRSWHSLKERFRKRIVPRLNRYKHLPPKLIQNLQKELGGGENSVPSQRRQKNSIKYTLDEDERILEFISTNKRYKEIKGKAMWVAMSKIYNHARTWESLKNRFLKNIVPHLYLFDLDEGVRANFEKVLKSKGKEKQTSFSRPGPYQRNRLRVGMKLREEESCKSSSSQDETTDVSSDEETAKENTKPAEKEQATVGSCSADKDPQASDFSHSSATRNSETKHELEASFYTEPELKLDSKDVTVFEEPLFPTSSQDSASEVVNTRDSSHNRAIPSKAGIKPKRVKLYSMQYDLFNKTPNPTGKSNSNPKMPSDAHSLANHSGEGKTLTVCKKTEGATALPTCSSEPRNVKSNSNENLLSSQNVSLTKKYGRGMKNAGCTPSDRRESDVIPRVSLTPVEYMPEFHEILRDPPQKRITTKGISLDTDIKRRRIRRTNIFT